MTGTWNNLPVNSGPNSLPANVAINNIGNYTNDWLNIALGLHGELGSTIDGISTALNGALTGLTLTYSPTLTTGDGRAPTIPGAAETALLTESEATGDGFVAPTPTLTAPDRTALPAASEPGPDFPTAPELTAAPTLTDPNPAFPSAPSLADAPTPTTSPAFQAILAAFPTIDQLPAAPTLAPPPSVADLPTQQAAPTAPGTDPVLNPAAYTDAFRLARSAALQAEGRALWDAERGAAANGLGLPFAAAQAAMAQARQARQQALSEAALTQAQRQAEHQREDARWGVEQRLAYWGAIEDRVVQRWQTEQTQRIGLWAQTVNTQLQQYGQFTDVLLRKFTGLTDAEAKRVQVRLSEETLKLDQWIRTNQAALDFWARPAEVRANLFQTTVAGESARVAALDSHQQMRVDVWARQTDAVLRQFTAEGANEAQRLQAVDSWQRLQLERWSRDVEDARAKWRDEGTMAISASQVTAQVLAQRSAAIVAQLDARLSLLRTNLQREAERRAWWQAADEIELRRAEAAATDAREMQKVLVDIGKEATYAVAGARAEHLKAILSAFSVSLGAGASISGVPFADAAE